MCMDGALKMYRIKRDKQDSVLGRGLVGFYHCATAAVVAAAAAAAVVSHSGRSVLLPSQALP